MFPPGSPRPARVLTRRVLVVLLVALAIAAMSAAAASAQISPTSEPLPGSSFQGGDGNQDDAGDLIDWQAMEAAGRAAHANDPNAEDSIFAGGSTEESPGDWDFTTSRDGADPGKDNIRDAWAGVDQVGEDTFLYLAFTRDSPSGDAFLTFELNRSGRTWNNGAAVIPCRRTGDVLISYEQHGNEMEVVLHRWRTTSANPSNGCAETGTLTDFTGLRPQVDVQGASNEADITSRLPGDIAGTVPARQFGETALNLSAALRRTIGDECLAFSSVFMHSRASESISSQMKDVLRPEPLPIRTCSASGTKFFDSDADGVRDAGEPGIPRFLIWADYDDDGARDRNEPFSVSDRRGRYVIFDIRPPDGTYTLRERLLPRRPGRPPVAADWICSYPNASTPGGTGNAPGGRFRCGWGPIDVESTPNAEGLDFGNWFPARLTVEKELIPASDAGRFDLLVNGRVAVPAAGDGASTTLSVPPGTYEVSERPAAGTDAADYRSVASCRTDASAAGRNATEDTSLTLTAGQEASCKFFNVRIGSPAIGIRKFGTLIATAGDTLRYFLVVSNPGFIPIPEGGITVTDEQCDSPPELRSKPGDATPATLDPGDRWIYGCTRATPAGGEDCEVTTVSNTGSATATVAGATVADDDSLTTILRCPDDPEPPEPPKPIDPPGPVDPPGPDPPAPVAPVGPAPPPAGDAAVAGVRRLGATGCLPTRVPRVNLRGTRIASVRISVNGRRFRTLDLRILQRRAGLRLRLQPGRYRVTARVTFERGSGTVAVTLTRTLRVCGQRVTVPRFTG
jgi:hypothetical protein